ncbi:VOC family protein [Saccharomonospora sp. NPDC046836]|uniref:VOC family protein n=1 Tax=Saccharomonospora sp. NPDC046836 TaxID=3156921 RepID=UPI0033FE3EE7
MTVTLAMVTIDCADPRRLAEFWTKALETDIALDYGEFLMLNPTGGGVRLALQQVPEPRAGKNRIHVDLETTDRPGDVAKLVGLGATQLAEHEAPGFAWTVLSDPEGNQFCVAEHHD